MCGIAGVFEYASGRTVDPGTIEPMLEAIRHRGPDEGGAYVNGPVAIGTRRLSIIDLEGGHQPMPNEDGSVRVVSNGEIYNYRELAAQLRGQGHRLGTVSDTETIVHLYEEHDDAFVTRLRGMFGLAIWDERRGRLVLARDRLGIKPLYYADLGGRLVFGSEIKAILEHPAVAAQPDLQALMHMLALKYVPSPETLFTGIKLLPPGHLLACDTRGPRVEKYWDLSFVPGADAPTGEEEATRRLEELLVDAVRSHLVSDVPFGAFLSGGVDSSTVVALMSQELSAPVKTFAVGFKDVTGFADELPYARLVAERWGTEHHEVLIDVSDFVDRIESVVWHLDQPIGDEASLPNYMVSDLAAREVKMILSGEGGDELFAGYARYSYERLAPYMAALPGPARSLAVAAADRLPRLRRAKIALRALAETDEAKRLATWFPLFNDERLRELARPELLAASTSTSADVFAAQLSHADSRDVIGRMLYVDTKLWLPDDLLARGDKTSMAASLEARVPLLDHPLVEFAASLPSSLKLHGKTRKYLLRKVAAKWLPEEILTRKKQGFPTPVSLWFRGGARDFLRDHLSADTLRKRALFEPAAVQRLLDEHERGFADHGALLYGLLTVELWYRRYIDAPGAASGRQVATAAVGDRAS